MIKSTDGKVEILGKKEDVIADLSCIFNILIKHIGDDETKEMIRVAYEVVTEDLESKIKKELKEIIKRDLPEDLAKILLELV